MKVGEVWRAKEPCAPGIYEIIILTGRCTSQSDAWWVDMYLSDESAECALPMILTGEEIYKYARRVSGA
jgi:hypothetical protein